MIKWFDSKLMTGIPELTNTQGDLVKMLNGLLVNGANSKAVTSLSYTNGVCTLTLGANHGFARHSVINIQGSNQAALINSEFRIKSFTVTTISFDCPTAVTSETGLTVRYAPLGWTQHFASEGRSCYRSPDPRYPAYLRVDDVKFENTNTDAAKFAGVEICADMTDFNTASWQAPFTSDYPQQNRQTITNRSNGWFKWVYAGEFVDIPDLTPTQAGTRDYVLIGDDSQFWLLLYPYASNLNQNYPVIVGMPILDYGIKKPQALVATNGFSAFYYPHWSFVDTDRPSVAPYLENGLAVAIGKPNYSYPLKDMLLQTPVFIVESDQPRFLSAVFENCNITPSVVEKSIVKTQDKRFLVTPYSNATSAVFDIGAT